MPTYIVLMNLTDKGIQDIKNAPARLAEQIKGAEAVGGKIVGVYLTMGQYDYVVIAEAPNDETAFLQLIGLGIAGNVRTTTLKAFKREEFENLLKKMP